MQNIPILALEAVRLLLYLTILTVLVAGGWASNTLLPGQPPILVGVAGVGILLIVFMLGVGVLIIEAWLGVKRFKMSVESSGPYPSE